MEAFTLLDGGCAREPIGLDNLLTHKANFTCILSVHLNGSTILLSRLSLARIAHASTPREDVIGLTLFPPLPYHPPHATKSDYPHYQQHGGRLGGVPR